MAGARRAKRGRAALRSRTLAAAIAVSACAMAATARAAEDGAYGRLDGDVGFSLGAGAAIARGGPSLAVQASAIYVGTAGLYAMYTDALGSGDRPVTRSIGAGLSLRPLFLARYGSDLERGPARLDLLLDSLDFDLGAFWHASRGSALEERPGLEIALGADLPILERATGPYLGVRAALRWRAEDLAEGASGGIVDRGALLSLTLAWHHIVGAHVVDAGDGILR